MPPPSVTHDMQNLQLDGGSRHSSDFGSAGHLHHYPHYRHDFLTTLAELRGDVDTPLTPFTSASTGSSRSTLMEPSISSLPSLFATPSFLDTCCMFHENPGPSWYPSVRENDDGHASVQDPTICKWQTESGAICGHPISVAHCSEHLATAHGISKMALDFRVACRWCPDGARPVKRANIVRHVRESHLHHPRRASRLGRNLPA
ncbi:hypothetical protein L210DRAFT_2235413 [Boletus edulis BED1]|uniref:Uncharacterized protein n=1 Tax=Boletus edulis BED1 TaxID=1328754 RepID=A0AAD4BTG5_BOLED|nr:hypothetical protein L210DRAFT_2235413 [Boletus edulis BED1]